MNVRVLIISIDEVKKQAYNHYKHKFGKILVGVYVLF